MNCAQNSTVYSGKNLNSTTYLNSVDLADYEYRLNLLKSKNETNHIAIPTPPLPNNNNYNNNNNNSSSDQKSRIQTPTKPSGNKQLLAEHKKAIDANNAISAKKLSKGSQLKQQQHPPPVNEINVSSSFNSRKLPTTTKAKANYAAEYEDETFLDLAAVADDDEEKVYMASVNKKCYEWLERYVFPYANLMSASNPSSLCNEELN